MRVGSLVDDVLVTCYVSTIGRGIRSAERMSLGARNEVVGKGNVVMWHSTITSTICCVKMIIVEIIVVLLQK